MHAHWVIPNGVMAMLAAGRRPLVVSLHGSDVFVAERHRRSGARRARSSDRAAWVTACSDDLRARALALGADPARTEMLPYGVDAERFAPSADEPDARPAGTVARRGPPVVFTAGRLVAKKGFEYLIEAARQLSTRVPHLRVLIAGDGDLRDDLGRLAATTAGVVTLLGNRSQDDIAALAAAADVIAVPSIHDAAGNVDGLPNFALEALASATPVVATRVGGLPQAITRRRDGTCSSPKRDSAALAAAIGELLADPARARAMGAAARATVVRDFGWARVAERLEHAYDVRDGTRACRIPRLSVSVLHCEPVITSEGLIDERGLPRVLSRATRAHDRRRRIHRIEPGPAPRRPRRRRADRRFPAPRLRGQSLQSGRVRSTVCG